MSEDLDAIRVITEPELRRILSISDQTFERLKARGDVPPKTQLSDRRTDIKAWLDRRRQPLTTGDAA